MPSFINVTTFTFAICLAMCFSVAGTSFTRAAFTTIERYFGVSSTKISVYASFNQMAAIVITPAAVHFTRNMHIPRILYFSFLAKAIGFVVLVLPYFLGPRYFPDGVDKIEANESLITGNIFCQNEAEEGTTRNSMGYWEYCIPISKIIIGVGGCLIWPHSISFIDNNSKQGQSLVLFGFNFVGILLGPMLAYSFASYVLSLWVNFTYECAPDWVDPNGSDWIGAWWVGYVIAAASLLIFSTPLAFFPRSLKNKNEDNKEEKEEIDENLVLKDHFENEVEKTPESSSSMISETKALLKNPLFVMQVLAGIVNSWAMATKATFGQKYIEIQFGLSPADAAQLKVFYIGSLCVGFLVGGLIVKKLKLKPFNVAVFLFVVQTLYSITFLLLWSFEGCSPQSPDLLFGSKEGQSLADCDCRTDKFVPVCGQNITMDGKIYDELTILSPCKAGCSDVELTYSKEEKEFFGCPVVSKGIDNRKYLDCAVPVETGICGAEECKTRVWIYLALVCLGTFFSGVNGSPGTVFLLRSVGSERKPYAMSILGTCMKLFGWLPAPILYAKLFDSLCAVKGSLDNCVFYDNNSVRHFYFGINAVIAVFYTVINCCFLLVIWRRYKSNKPMWGGMDMEKPF
ncbi:Oidioi.mRNA.OKI2018_I69.PAR.g12900.t1.cds [Oikopleura dioica]|uniref:Oidioi.mRNA.OKI2018_I69.PAR.g12900.t1.cds n=1 Tax=Oikopleura dioica TaxID=34765 RepID=A0ABN7S5D1_OIKDI|nr:Oidioi.mRNA.OKI2018_I69.PAR.g12900.t1.cds [Oikopleura dioica]